MYKDVTLNFIKNKCTKVEFLLTLDELLDNVYGDKEAISRISQYFKESIEKNPKRKQYYTSKGLTPDEAYCCALSLSYYTGAQGTKTSEVTNRRASGVLRFGLKDKNLQMQFQNIYYFLMKKTERKLVPFLLRKSEILGLTIRL